MVSCHRTARLAGEVDADDGPVARTAAYVIVQTCGGAWGAPEVELGQGQIAQAAENLLAFAGGERHRQGRCPGVLGVFTVTGYADTRDDGVVVIPIGALGP